MASTKGREGNIFGRILVRKVYDKGHNALERQSEAIQANSQWIDSLKASFVWQKVMGG